MLEPVHDSQVATPSSKRLDDGVSPSRERPWRPSSRHGIAAALFVLYVGVGLLWLVSNVGDVPHYGDTHDYLKFARQEKVNAVRGYLYPRLLAAAGALCLESELPKRVDWGAEEAGGLPGPCAVPRGFACIQLLQVLASAAAVGYFAWVVGPALIRRGHSSRWLFVGGLAALVALDPLIAHFNLALMTDGLCFSASLAYCAAWAHLLFLRRTTGWAAAVIFASFLVAAGLRVEKPWVLLATALVSVTLAGWMSWRRPERQASSRSRILLGLAVVGAAFFVHQAVQSASSEQDSWWTAGENAVHFRLVFPYLDDVYDQLPDRVRQKISRDQAREYSRDINRVRPVVNRAVGLDAAARRRLTEDMVRTVVAQKWPDLLRDIPSDVLANGWTTLHFADRVLAWELRGRPGGPATWTFTRFTFHHPGLSRLWLGLAGALFLLALAAALVPTYRRLRAPLRSASGRASRTWLLWAPAVSFWWLNAATFGLSVNIINVRYMIFSHGLLLLLAYATVLAWLLAPGPAVSDER